MKRKILMLAAGIVIAAGASNAQAFELFRGHHGLRGCHAPVASCCEVVAEPVCCEPAPAPVCCEADPCAKRPGLLARIHAKKAAFWANVKARHNRCCAPVVESCCEAPVVESCCN